MAKSESQRVTGLNNLTDAAIRKLSKPGLYADGGKLYLAVKSVTQKSWVFVFQWGGKRKEMGLGSLQDVGLAEARRRRQAAQDALNAGDNPIDVRARDRAAQAAKEAEGQAPTFGKCAAEVLKVKGPKGEVNRKKWLATMTKGVPALDGMLPAAIRVADVMAALAPYWHDKPRQADVIRYRIELVLNWANAKGFIPDPWSNPAKWVGNLEWRMEARADTRTHHASLPYKLAGTFMANLRSGEKGTPLTRMAAELCILTAVRETEAAGAKVAEFDLEADVWTVPGERMKMGRPHRVPLSPAARAVVVECMAMAEAVGSPYLFPSARTRTGRITSLSLAHRVRSALKGVGDGTLHGFRATFKDWSLDVAKVDDRISEECLAHVVGNAVRNAYRRDDNLEGRRPVMEAWGEFLAVEWSDNVVPLGNRKAA